MNLTASFLNALREKMHGKPGSLSLDLRSSNADRCQPSACSATCFCVRSIVASLDKSNWIPPQEIQKCSCDTCRARTRSDGDIAPSVEVDAKRSRQAKEQRKPRSATAVVEPPYRLTSTGQSVTMSRRNHWAASAGQWEAPSVAMGYRFVSLLPPKRSCPIRPWAVNPSRCRRACFFWWPPAPRDCVCELLLVMEQMRIETIFSKCGRACGCRSGREQTARATAAR